MSSSKQHPRDIKFPIRYTDEPSIAGSSASAIPLLGYEDDVRDADELLPGYSNAVDGGGAAAAGEEEEDAPPEFAHYRPVVKRIKTKLGMGDVITVSHDPHLNTDGEALYRWLIEESYTLPEPEVRIRGTHQVRRRNGKKTETSTTTDFDLKLSLREYLLENPDTGITSAKMTTVSPEKKTNRGGRWKRVATEAEAEEARTVRSWADQYCEDKSTLKEFIMKKSCTGWELERMKCELERLIRSTNYLGRLEIDFPVFNTRVEVVPANRISRMRTNEYWRWFFYLTFLWILVWPFLWFFTKRYHVAETVFHYTIPNFRPSGETVWVAMEDEWLQKWGPAIKRAAKAHRKDWVTTHDIDAVADRAGSGDRTGTVRPPVKTGNSAIDGALGFMAGVGSIANDMLLSRSELVGWGGDEEGW